MAVTQQIAANYIPFFRYKTVSTGAFGSSSNTATVVDPSVASNSIILVTATAAPAGLWYVTATAGTGFTVTSSDPESSTSFNYIVL